MVFIEREGLTSTRSIGHENSCNNLHIAGFVDPQPEREAYGCKSLIAKLLNKYHVSAAEVGEQDMH